MIERLELAETALTMAQSFMNEALAALAVIKTELEDCMPTETLTIKLTGVAGGDDDAAYPDHTGTLK